MVEIFSMIALTEEDYDGFGGKLASFNKKETALSERIYNDIDGNVKSDDWGGYLHASIDMAVMVAMAITMIGTGDDGFPVCGSRVDQVCKQSFR
jgi:hypothetical protein